MEKSLTLVLNGSVLVSSQRSDGLGFTRSGGSLMALIRITITDTENNGASPPETGVQQLADTGTCQFSGGTVQVRNN